MQKQIFIFLCYNSCGMHVNQEEVQQERWLYCQKEPQRDARLAEDEEGSRGCWDVVQESWEDTQWGAEPELNPTERLWETFLVGNEGLGKAQLGAMCIPGLHGAP